MPPVTTKIPGFTQPPRPPDEKSRHFWQLSGQQILKEQLEKPMNKNVAKNLIILVADGMSIATQTAARMYLGGEEKVLSFEKFPFIGLSKVKFYEKISDLFLGGEKKNCL